MNILAGYDPFFSNIALLNRVIADAKAYNAHVFLVTSFQDGKEATSDVTEKAQAELDKAQQKLRDHNISSETHILVRNLSVGEDLVAFANENAVDEIIVEIRKLSKVGKLVTGSTAQHVILNAPCPVVAVKTISDH